MKDLLKTPKQRRIELGIDTVLIRQVRHMAEKKARSATKGAKRRAPRYKLRETQKGTIEKMRLEGYTMTHISAKLVIPGVCSGCKKKRLKNSAKDRLSENMKNWVSKKLNAHEEKEEAAGEAQSDKKHEGKDISG